MSTGLPRRSTRAVVVGTLATAALAGGGAIATASTASAEAAPSARTMAIEDHCNNNVCLEVDSGVNGWYSVRAYFRPSAAPGSPSYFNGHFDFRGPGLNRSSDNTDWPMFKRTIWYGAQGVGTVCVEGWANFSGSWRSVGLPCGPTH